MYLIDLREEQELYDFRILPLETKEGMTPVSAVVCIPTRYIPFNVERIQQWSQEGKVYLICRSSGRSQKVKQRFFEKNEQVISISGGIEKGTEMLQSLGYQVVPGEGGYGFQQKMQMVFCVMLMCFLIMLLSGMSRVYVTLFLVGCIFFLISQIYTKSCVLSKYVLPPI